MGTGSDGHDSGEREPKKEGVGSGSAGSNRSGTPGPKSRIRRVWTGAVSGLAVALVAYGLSRALHLSSPVTGSGFKLPRAAVQAEAEDGMTAVPNLTARNFRLTDQNGRPLSLTELRGKAVVLTFLDPVCWLQCPLQAQDMRLMLRYLPASARKNVALVAVATNPAVHSLASVRAFDQEQGLGEMKNWYFLTSKSLPALQKVWQHYYVDVSAPRDGMVDHSQVFYLIAPNGQVRYLSNPTDQPGGFVGTAQLLAAYTARILNVTPDFVHAGPEVSTPSLSYTAGLDLSKVSGRPVMLSPKDGWRLAVQQGYELLLRTRDGGHTWANVSPPGVSKRGGLAVGFGPDGEAWVVVLPYGYNLIPVSFFTDNWGRTWRTTDLLPSRSVNPAWTSPLAASGTRAYLLTTSGVLAAQGESPWQRLAGLPSALPPHATLSVPSPGQLRLSGGGLTWQWSTRTGWRKA